MGDVVLIYNYNKGIEGHLPNETFDWNRDKSFEIIELWNLKLQQYKTAYLIQTNNCNLV